MRSGTRLLGYRKGVAIRVPEVGNLGSPLKRSDALLVRDDSSHVVVLEGHALGGELVDDSLNVVYVPAGQGRPRLACVLRREVDVQNAPLRAPIRYVVARVDAHREAQLAFVELSGMVHVRDRQPCDHLVLAQAHRKTPSNQVSRPTFGTLSILRVHVSASATFRELRKAEVQLRRIVFCRHPSVNSAAGISHHVLRTTFASQGVRSLPNGKPLAPQGGMATCTQKTGKAAPLRQAAQG